VFVEVTLCIKAFWREKQTQASGHPIAGFEHGKGKRYRGSCPDVFGYLLRLLIALAKAVRINGFLHPKEQGEDAKYPIPIGPTVNTILSSPSLSLAIADIVREHL
jgi:hypothetical protein